MGSFENAHESAGGDMERLGLRRSCRRSPLLRDQQRTDKYKDSGLRVGYRRVVESIRDSNRSGAMRHSSHIEPQPKVVVDSNISPDVQQVFKLFQATSYAMPRRSISM